MTERKDFFLGFGINEYPGAPLNGCVNDIKQSLHLLVTGWGTDDHFNYEDCRPCTDFRATCEGMKFRLEQIANQVKAGDRIFIAVSGHGAQIPTRDDELGEVDGKIEVICPYDFDFDDPTKYIPDYVFVSILSRILYGVNCTVLLDCCFSGGLPNEKALNPTNPKKKKHLRLSRSYPIRRNFDMDFRMKIAEKKGLFSTMPSMAKRGILDGVVFINGCQEQQTCADAWFGGDIGYQGATTKFFWDEIRANPDAPIQDIVINMGRALKNSGFEQTPSIVGPEHLLALPFMGKVE